MLENCQLILPTSIAVWKKHLQENVRASKLADTLTAVEDKLADQDMQTCRLDQVCQTIRLAATFDSDH